MKQIEYLVKTLSPVIFAEKNNDSTLYSTKKYISGSIFRGMVANYFIRKYNLGQEAHKDEKFFNLFLSGKVRFLPAYPMGKNFVKDLEPFVLPLSLMRNKKGDSLVDISDGTKIESGYKKLTGFALKKDSEIYKVNVDTQIEFHMARNDENSRILGSNKDGRVFNYEYIEAYQYFKGSIIVEDELADELYKCLQLLAKDNIYIGRSRSVQYGSCSLKILDMQQIANPKIKQGNKYYLYAYTPYIPKEDWNRVDCLLENICDSINKKLSNAKMVDKIYSGDLIYSTTEEYSGYVGVWKVRRERKIALSAGSLLEIKLDNVNDDFLYELNKVLNQGLGCRTEEGFGQFRLFQPMQNLNLKEMPELLNTKKDLSSLVKKQAKEIIQKRLFEEIKKQAVDDLSKKTKFYSNSKNTLNHIEELVCSEMTKAQIQEEIKNFKDLAKKNLRQMFIDSDSFFEIMTEKNNVSLPYRDIVWEKRLFFGKDNEKILSDIEKDLGKDIFKIDEDRLYKEYFLWFVRHAKKMISNKKAEKIDDLGE